jgi:hypothetical protein
MRVFSPIDRLRCEIRDRRMGAAPGSPTKHIKDYTTNWEQVRVRIGLCGLSAGSYLRMLKKLPNA